MFNYINSVRNFINYWYFRYLLVTELYMVEKWERVMFHVILLVLLSVAYLFNTSVILGLTKMLTKYTFSQGLEQEGRFINVVNTDSEL